VLALSASELPAPQVLGGIVWGDGLEVETVINYCLGPVGLRLVVVPSLRRCRLSDRSGLRTAVDGARVVRSAGAGRRCVRGAPVSTGEPGRELGS
jgi:hypothetical protein